jgi:hypothetical protein
MNTIYIDPAFDEPERRKRMYDGQLMLLTATPAAWRIVDHARTMLETAFAGHDPRDAQYAMPVEDFAAILTALKPAFIHHEQSWRSIAQLLTERGCDPLRTYLDVPRLRISTSDGYLTSGVAYAHHPHRDTWWSAPLQQINWWIPLYEFASESAMAFHPAYWNRAVVNDSSLFNYYDWNSNQRKNAAQHVKSDTRWQPHALETLTDLQPELRIVCPAGGAIAFSGTQLHSTVPNTSGRTRYSIDFRTVDLDDVIARVGAPNADSAPAGTSLRDFKRLVDGERIPEAIAAAFDGELAASDGLIFQPA